MKIQRYRKKMKIKQLQACEQLKCSYTTYWRWESGTVIPNKKSMAKISAWSDGNVTARDFY